MRERKRGDAPLLHALLDLGHVRVVRAPREPAALERARVEDEAALVHELVRVERVGEDELRAANDGGRVSEGERERQGRGEGRTVVGIG